MKESLGEEWGLDINKNPLTVIRGSQIIDLIFKLDELCKFKIMLKEKVTKKKTL